MTEIMLAVRPHVYVNACAAARIGIRGTEAYERTEPEIVATQPARRTPTAANDDTPIFDIAREMPRLVDDPDDIDPVQAPTRQRPRGALCFRYGADGPTVDWRVDAQAGRLTSNRFSGQAANDNLDWPLAKLLRAEGADYHLSLAERYRDLWNAANMPHDLVGRDLADNVYLMVEIEEDESTGARRNKGVKKVVGKKARLDVAATRAVAADPDKTKRRSKPIPKKWTGDWPLLHAIDCGRELASAQTALGWLREAFEAAVVFGATLESVGRGHGVGNKAGAKGAGRALVMLGLQCVDEFWRKPARRMAA
ncbi:hypothetical protein [Mesorhizobium sp. YM1C-6-2]|uniref:hypothetical protein n=1 Tax=Mesorhizobium sp. YM1C-6-2 TaxID=1827501 RepID=UPI000EF204BA|nr:hypothetical protein [Mesorhizobium sp. YM1C-6-2]RLP22178.1 hypothetical protein D8676_25485 [Mesorhizobium sp. YM1C-6-2]